MRIRIRHSICGSGSTALLFTVLSLPSSTVVSCKQSCSTWVLLTAWISLASQASANRTFFWWIFFCLRERWPVLLLHNDPAAHQDHCGICRIRTRDLCPEQKLQVLRDYCTVYSVYRTIRCDIKSKILFINDKYRTEQKVSQSPRN